MRNNPIKQLTAEDIARKQKKLDRINTKIGKKEQKFKDKVSSGKKGTDMDIANFEKSLTGLKERRHKTEYQINTGKRGRPTSLKNEAWLADSPVRQDTFGGTPDKTKKQEAYEEATNQLYDEGLITQSNNEADKLIEKRMKENAKKFAKSLKKK